MNRYHFGDCVFVFYLHQWPFQELFCFIRYLHAPKKNPQKTINKATTLKIYYKRFLTVVQK